MSETVNEKICTLLFLRRGDEILLAMKKRGFGEGNFNGVGGKVEPPETIDDAMVREAWEEIGVRALKYWKVAENDFLYQKDGETVKRMYTHVYESDEWEGEPTETEEMAPQWFNVTDIPYDKMWPDDTYWLPEVLAGNKVFGVFTFDEQNTILSHDVKVVDTLPSE